MIDALISEYIHSERDRLIMHRRLCDGILFEPLAEEFGLSVQRTKAIYYRCMDKLARHIK